MNEQVVVPKWFWVVSILALIWNLLGVGSFIANVMTTPEALAALPADQANFYASTPAWAIAAFAVAVFGGTLGSLGLLLRKSWAKTLFIASLAGVILQMGHAFLISNSYEIFGPGGLIMPAMIVVVAILLIWLANVSIRKLWIS